MTVVDDLAAACTTAKGHLSAANQKLFAAADRAETDAQTNRRHGLPGVGESTEDIGEVVRELVRTVAAAQRTIDDVAKAVAELPKVETKAAALHALAENDASLPAALDVLSATRTAVNTAVGAAIRVLGTPEQPEPEFANDLRIAGGRVEDAIIAVGRVLRANEEGTDEIASA